MVPWSNALVHTRSGKSALRPLSSRILPAVALGIAVVVSLSACGGDANSEPTDDPTEPSASSSPEYVPASADGPAQNVPVPELPDEAHEQTAEGAEAALKHWWDTLEYLYLTGDAEPMGMVSQDICELCGYHEENWTSAYADDHWIFIDGNFDIAVDDVEIQDSGASAFVEYVVEQPSTLIYGPSGDVVDGKETESSFQPWTTYLDFNESQGHWELYDGQPEENDEEDGDDESA